MFARAVEFYSGYANTWYFAYLCWLTAGEILGCLVVVGSITVASSPSIIVKYIDIKTIAFFVAVLSGINTFLDPLGRAQAYGTALTSLTEVMEDIYLHGSSDPKLEENVNRLATIATQGLTGLRDKAVAQRPLVQQKQ